MDGHVNKEERLSLWNSLHRRIIFATPQAFKNDVFKGQALHLCPLTSPSLPAAMPQMPQPLTITPALGDSSRNPQNFSVHLCIC